VAGGNNTKMNISYTIRAIDRFTKTHQRLQRQLNQLEAMTNKLSTKKEIKVDADTTNATRSLRRAEKQANSIPRRIKTHVQVEYKKFRSAFNRMADTLRDFDEISLSMVKGGIFTALPALVPIIGVAAGGIGAMGAALLSAGAGAAGFAAVAVPTINSVIEANNKLTEAQEKVNKATNPKERAEAMKELTALQSKYTKEQLESVKALQKFNSFFSNFRKQFEPGVLSAFNAGLEALQRILEMSQPAIQGVTDAVNNLMLSLNKNLGASDVKEFFTWMGETAGPYLEKLTTAFGNFAMGLINMLVAFDPLAQAFANGLLDMSERFREWSATLEQNQEFQNFMKFVQENAPTVLSLLGNLVQTLVNFGVAMAPVGTAVLNAANVFFKWTAELFKNHTWIAKLIAIVTVAMGLFRIFWPIISLGISVFRILKPALQGGEKGFSKLKGPVKNLMPIIKTLGSIVLFFARSPLGILISVVITVAAIIVKNWDTIRAKTSEIFKNVSDRIKQEIDRIKINFAIVETIVKVAVSQFNNFRESVKKHMEAAGKIIKTSWKIAESFLGNINLYPIGRAIMQGLINGINALVGPIQQKIRDIANLIPSWAKKMLGIHSPSRVMYQIGKFVGEGLKNGIAGTSSQVQKTTQNLVNKIKDAVQTGLETKKTKTKQLNSAVETLRQQQRELNAVVRERRATANNIARLNEKLSTTKSKSKRSSISKQIASERKRLANLTKRQQVLNSRVKQSREKVTNLRTDVRDAEKLISLRSLQSYINQQTKKLNTIAKKRDEVVAKLKDANKKLADLIKESEEYARNIAEKARSFGSITSLQVSEGQQLDAGTIKNHLQQRLKDIQDFAANIDKLRKKGLSESIIADILEQGVDQGASYAAALANADAMTIKQINSLQSQINKASDTLGKKAADAMYSAGINAAKGLIKGLESQKKQLDKAANAIADAIAKAVKTKLKIHSPSRVLWKLGIFAGKGFVLGLEKMRSAVAETSTRMANETITNATPSFNASVANKPPKAIKREYVEVSRPETQQTVNSNAGSIASQPVIINLRLGTRDFRWFVEDITKAQRQNKKTVDTFRG